MICLIAGVKGCNSKKSNKPINSSLQTLQPYRLLDIDNYPNVYKAVYNSTVPFVLPYQDGNVISGGLVDCTQFYVSAQTDVVLEYDVQGQLYYNDGLLFNVDKFYATFKCLRFNEGSSTYYYRFYSYNAYNTESDSYINIIYKYRDYANDEYYEVDYDTRIYRFVVTYDLADNSAFNYFFVLQDSLNFIFNKTFNYNEPLNTSILSPYGVSGNFIVNNEYGCYIDYDVGYFLCNDQIFNRIRWRGFKADNVYFEMQNTSGGTTFQKAGSNAGYYYVLLEYWNTDSNYGVTVNLRDSRPFVDGNGGTAYYQCNSSTWVIDKYRYIVFLESLSIDLKTSIESFNNNIQSYYSGQIYSDGGDVFSLLSHAFVSLTDFLSINILPGISIGVLLFMPLIVGIIVIMFHILKK